MEKAAVWVVLMFIASLVTGKISKATNHPLFIGLNVMAFVGLVGCFIWFIVGLGQYMMEVAFQ